MSTSPRRALLPESPQPPCEFQPFPYDSVAQSAPGQHIIAASAPDPTAIANHESQLVAEGRQEGIAQARKLFEEHLAGERARISTALAEFARERAAYFTQVEPEVVRLVLAIARKVLHREAQVDPLLLAGITRVALERINGTTRVILRVHPQNAAEWQQYLAIHLDRAQLPEILEDPAQPPDRCQLETSMGSATIGLEVQLKEIEQGLMDLLSARPGVTP